MELYVPESAAGPAVIALSSQPELPAEALEYGAANGFTVSKMAVGEGDLLPRGLQRPDALAQLGDGQDQPHRISSSGRGSLSTARRSSSGEQVAVPIFITTTPPA